jgi:hypothetical protein
VRPPERQQADGDERWNRQRGKRGPPAATRGRLDNRSLQQHRAGRLEIGGWLNHGAWNERCGWRHSLDHFGRVINMGSGGRRGRRGHDCWWRGHGC